MPLAFIEARPGWFDWWYRVGLSPFTRLFLLALIVVCIYTTYLAGLCLVRLNYLRKQNFLDQQSLSQVSFRVQNLRQLITAMFFLFGMTQIQGAYWTPENNRGVGLMVLENFRTEFSFAACICFVFLVLHSVQWFVWRRICKAGSD